MLLLKDAATYDISENIIQGFTWKGKKESPCRTLSFRFLDTENKIDIITGDKVIMLDDEANELFRGIILKAGVNQDRIYNVRAYDSAYYLLKNFDTFSFKKKTAAQIFTEVCNRFQIKIGETVNTNFVIDGLTCVNKSLIDVIIQALSITYKNTGIRYYIRSEKGKLNLLKRREQAQILVLEEGVNINSFNIVDDATDIKNRVKIETSAGVLENSFIKNSAESQLKYGILQYYKKQTEFIMPGAASDLASKILKEKNKIKKDISVECLGDTNIISGNAVILNLPDLNITKAFYIDSDTHTFRDGLHTMSVSLKETNEV